MLELKKCSKCGIDKPSTLEFFYKHKNGLRPDCKQCCSSYYKKYRNANKDVLISNKKLHYESKREIILARQRDYVKVNKEKRNEASRIYRRNRMQIDTSFKLTCALRSRLWKAISGYVKSDKTINFLGCSIEFLKQHLEGQFTDGMSWENYGEWHIDHKRPCSSFDLSDPNQQKECFHFSNLQPLWAKENFIKSSKWEGDAACRKI